MELVSDYISCKIKGVKLFAGDFISFTYLGEGTVRGCFLRADMDNDVFKYIVIDDNGNGVPHYYELSCAYGIEIHPVPARLRR
jgi:hypothetical protein